MDTVQRESVPSFEGRFFSKGVPQCPAELVNLDPTDRYGFCAFRCNRDGMFDDSKKEFARFWMLLWASVNLGVTAFTVFTFIIDRQRFRFPERLVVIFFQSSCFTKYHSILFFPDSYYIYLISGLH